MLRKKWFLLSVICFFFLFVLIYQSLSQDKKEEVSEEEIKALVEKLSSKFYDDREFAKQELIKIGPKVEPFVIEGLKSDNSKKKRNCIKILKALKLKSSIIPLIDEMLKTENSYYQEIISEALVEFGKDAYEIINQYLEKEEIKSDQNASNLLNNVKKNFFYTEVERLLLDLISEDLGYGFYEGQFKKLQALDKNIVVPILRDIIADDYEFKSIEVGDRRQSIVKTLAIEAIGEIADSNDEETIKLLKKLIDDNKTASFETIAYALWRLGETSYLENEIKKLEEAINGDNEAARMQALYRLPFIYTRIGNYEKAKDAYLKVLESGTLGGNNQIVYYNLACIFSKMEKKDEAIDYLKKAINAGYRDVGWMKKDGDLDFIRDSAEFKDLIKKLEEGWEPEEPDIPEEKDILIEEE